MSNENQSSHNYNSGRIRRSGTGGSAPQPPPASGRQGQAPRQQMPAQNAGQDIWQQQRERPPQQSGGAPRQGSQMYQQVYQVQQPRQQAPRSAYDQDAGQARQIAANQTRAGGGMQQQTYTYSRQQAQPPPQQVASNISWAEPEEDPLGPVQGKGKAKGGTKGQKPRKSRRFKVIVSLAVVLCLLTTGVLAALGYAGNLLDPGAFGRIIPALGGEPTAYSGKEVNILIIGIDYEDGRQYAGGLGLTDMVLYARYNLQDNSLSLLQIPRDSYVGENYSTGGTGKINALLISGENKSAPINNISSYIEKEFKLPVDHYVAMDMDALKAIVNTFGGIRVYVPRDMQYDGSYLAQGWQWLDGDAAEFFVRNRHGEGFARGDIDRLDNQRHFYSALFRRFLNLSPKDVMNLLPVFDHYCNTDIGLSKMISIGVAALNLQAENVIFAKVPGATGPELDPTGSGRSLYFIDVYGRGTEQDPGLATLLNQYFRDAEKPVEADALGLPQISIPGSYALYPPNVQGMAEVQEPEGGTDVDVEPGS